MAIYVKYDTRDGRWKVTKQMISAGSMNAISKHRKKSRAKERAKREANKDEKITVYHKSGGSNIIRG